MTVGVSHPAAHLLVLTHVLPLPIWEWPPYLYEISVGGVTTVPVF